MVRILLSFIAVVSGIVFTVLLFTVDWRLGLAFLIYDWSSGIRDIWDKWEKLRKEGKNFWFPGL